MGKRTSTLYTPPCLVQKLKLSKPLGRGSESKFDFSHINVLFESSDFCTLHVFCVLLDSDSMYELCFKVYENDKSFDIGQANFIREGKAAAIFGAGITLHNALEAAEQLAKEGIEVAIIDPFTIKPMDANAVKKAVEMTGGKLITVEDHYAYVSQKLT